MNEYLDILGQQPLLKIYTQITLCFPVNDTSLHPEIINTLRHGLERLSSSFPWIAGQVINEGVRDGNGLFKIVPLEEIPSLIIKDLRDDPSAPTMNDLRRAHFPFRMLDESITAPRRTLPDASEEGLPARVFLVQISFIYGGLLLTFVGQHNTMDMTGQAHIIDLLSKACRNEPFTNEEICTGNLARYKLIAFLDDDSYKDDPDLARQIMKPAQLQLSSNDYGNKPTPPPPPKCIWKYFSFNADALASLKTLAEKDITSPPGYISTDDALSAFIWQSIMRARSHRLDPTTKCTFARAVDVRRYLDIPDSYPGLIQNMAYTDYTLKQLLEEPLGAIASQLRLAVDPKTSNLRHKSQILATFIDQSPEKSGFSFTASLDTQVDVMLSSWARPQLYDRDFNLGLGKPEAIRRPQFDPVESLIYFMPKRLDGEIAVAICLRVEDMERFRVDKDVVKYSTYIE